MTGGASPRKGACKREGEGAGARLVAIDDPQDLRLAPYRAIRDRDLRRDHGGFIAEGTVVLRVLAAAQDETGGFRIESVLVLKNRVAGLGSILARLPADTPVYVTGRAVLDAVAGFPMHRGVLAFGRRCRTPGPDALVAGLPARALVLVGHAIANHDNMGALFRNAAVFGADAALFDARSCDPLYRKAIRVSVGGVFRLPFVHSGTLEETLAHLAGAGFDLWALSPRGQTRIEAVRPGPRTAFLVGPEGQGLPPSVLGRLKTARIAQASQMDSLNVAAASAIALHHFAGALGRV